MVRLIKWTISLSIVGGVVWACYGMYMPETPVVQPKQIEQIDQNDGLEQKVQGFVIDGRSPKGVKQWHLKGASAEIKDEDIFLDNLEVVAFGENATVNITSKKGIYKRGEGEVELIDDVRVVSDDGFLLTTDKAKWSQNTKIVFTDDVVHISHAKMKAVGEGGTADADKRKATLNKNVTVEIEPNTVVMCDGPLEVSYNDNIAIFHDNVRVKDAEGQLFAEKLTVDFDPETQKLAKVTAEHNVKVKRGKSYTICEKAIYADNTRSAKLLGRPRIIIDPEELAKLDAGFAN